MWFLSDYILSFKSGFRWGVYIAVCVFVLSAVGFLYVNYRFYKSEAVNCRIALEQYLSQISDLKIELSLKKRDLDEVIAYYERIKADCCRCDGQYVESNVIPRR